MGQSIKRTGLGVAAAAFAVLVSAVACGGGGGTDVEATLDEWSIAVDTAAVGAGEVKFKVENAGEEPHEFVVIKTDLAADALPVVDGKVDEEQVDLIDEIEPFAAGETEEITLDLEAGKYVLICNVVELIPGAPESHYENGMHVAFTVNP